MSRMARRLMLVTALVAGAMTAMAAPAFAHTEIELTPAQAGAVNATLKVTAEAESDSAGIASVQMSLPAGITGSQVTLVSGPAGWTLQPAADGFRVTGTPLKVKTDAGFTVTLAKLPADAGVLTFKTLVTYTNGDVDRWIGAPSDSNPAPFVSLSPAATPTAAPPTTAPATTAVITAAAVGDNGKSGGAGWVVAGIVAALAVAGAVLWAVRRRGSRPAA